MITVCCCVWGDWPASGWTEEYVFRLERAVARNLTVPYKFVVFADDPPRLQDNIADVRPLKAPVWKGCLPKLYVYSPEACLEGRVILFDLDNVIVGSIDDMAAYNGPFCVRAAIMEWDKGDRVMDGDMISFQVGEITERIWQEFSEDPQRHYRQTKGRERFFLRRHVPEGDVWQDVLPGQVVSFKAHCRKDGHKLPSDARVVSFHGRPRPHEKTDIPWVKEHWS